MHAAEPDTAPSRLPRLATPLGASLLLLGFAAGWAGPLIFPAPLDLAVVLVARILQGDGALFVGASALVGLAASGGATPAGVMAVLAAYPLWGLARRMPLSLEVRLGLVTALTATGAEVPWHHVSAAGEGVAATLALAFLLRFVGRLGRSPSGIREDLAVGILLLLATCGLNSLTWRGAPAALVVAAAGSLWAIFRRPEGVLLPPLFGVLLVVLGGMPPITVGSLALGAALAAIGLRWGRWAMGLGFLFGCTLAAAPSPPTAALPYGALALVGTFLFVLLPERIWTPPQRAIRLREVWSPRERLLQVSLALKEMASALAEPDDPPKPRSLFRTATVIESRVCNGCPHHRICWVERASYTQLGFRQAFESHDVGAPFAVKEIPEEVRKRCPRTREVALAATLLLEFRSREEASEARTHEISRLLGTEMRRAAGLVDLALTPQSEGEEVQRAFAFQVGLAHTSKGGRGLSGDGVVVREMPGGRLLLALSDGMGVGVRAYREANLALDLVERLLTLGVPTPELLDMVNALLLLRSSSDTFATLDIAVADLTTGEAEMVKVGAAPSFLVRGTEVERIASRAAPVGILEETSPQFFTRQIRPGDLLVILSDGLTGAGADWVEVQLRTRGAKEPQELADFLLERAIKLSGGETPDDMTVLVVAILPEEAKDPLHLRARVRRSLGRSRIGALPVGQAGSGGGNLPDGGA